MNRCCLISIEFVCTLDDFNADTHSFTLWASGVLYACCRLNVGKWMGRRWGWNTPFPMPVNEKISDYLVDKSLIFRAETGTWTRDLFITSETLYQLMCYVINCLSVCCEVVGWLLLCFGKRLGKHNERISTVLGLLKMCLSIIFSASCCKVNCNIGSFDPIGNF